MLERSIQWSSWWPFLGAMFVLKSTWMAPSGIIEHGSLGKSTSNSTHSKLNSRSPLSPQSPCPPEIYFSSYVPCLSILYHCPPSYAQARILNIKCIFSSPHSLKSDYQVLLIFQTCPLLCISSNITLVQETNTVPDSIRILQVRSNCSEDIHSCPISHLFSIWWHNLSKTSMTMS